MYNLWHKWKYRYSKLEWYDNSDVEMEMDIIKNYHDYPMYDPRHGWDWCIVRRYRGGIVYGIKRTRKEAYNEVKEHERIHDKILKELENERKHS